MWTEQPVSKKEHEGMHRMGSWSLVGAEKESPEDVAQSALCASCFHEVFDELRDDELDRQLFFSACEKALLGDWQGKKALRALFELTRPQWDRYTRYLEETTDFAKEEAVRAHITRGAITDVLAELTVSCIKDVCTELDIDPGRGRKKSDVISAVVTAIDGATNSSELAQSFRQMALDEFDEKSTAGFDHREMADLFGHRIVMMFYARRNMRNMLEYPESRPYWMWDAITDSRCYPECEQLDGIIKRFDDPFWKAHPIPCEKLMCRCKILSLDTLQASEGIRKQKGKHSAS